MSKDCSAYRWVGHFHVRDGKARADGEGKVGEVQLLWAPLTRKGKPSGRFFRSIVQVSVVECIGGTKHSPRRDHSQSVQDDRRYASYSFQIAEIRREADCQQKTHQAYEDDEKQRARSTNQEQRLQYAQNHRA